MAIDLNKILRDAQSIVHTLNEVDERIEDLRGKLKYEREMREDLVKALRDTVARKQAPLLTDLADGDVIDDQGEVIG